MARKTINYTVETIGRDCGKLFVITEMSALQASKWACKVFLALASSGVNLPDGFADAGMAGLAVLGIKCLNGIKWEVAEPLFDEIMGCVKIIPDSSRPHVVRNIIDEDIEEVVTHFALRAEVVRLHVDFLSAGNK